jgi:hypothetical protein
VPIGIGEGDWTVAGIAVEVQALRILQICPRHRNRIEIVAEIIRRHESADGGFIVPGSVIVQAGFAVLLVAIKLVSIRHCKQIKVASSSTQCTV